MQKSIPVVGAKRPKSPILRQKSGVIEYYGYRDYDAASVLWTARAPIGEKVSIHRDQPVLYKDGGSQAEHYNAGPYGDKLKQHHNIENGN